MQISHRFPSNNALYLLKKFGRTMDVPQNPSIITKLTLQIVDSDDTFELEYFPNPLPEFLVLKNIYE